jgi:hypothetical protein
MPINIDPKLIDELVKRQIAIEQTAQPVVSPVQEKSGPSKLAKIVYAAGGGADAASTLIGLKSGLGKEDNPLVNWAPKNAQVPLGAAMEVGSLALLNKILGKNHPKVMSAAMMGLGALHGGLSIANMKMLASAKNDQKSAAAHQPESQPPNLVQHPDGYWYDPVLYPQSK